MKWAINSLHPFKAAGSNRIVRKMIQCSGKNVINGLS